jgi:flagellar biosynthesis protein FlhG
MLPGGGTSCAGERAQTASAPASAHCLLFTSGKGGVGTSNLVLNLAIALGEREQRVLVLDGDVGLANLDVLGGLSPRFDLGDVLQGRCEVADAIVNGPSGIRVVPGAHAARTSLNDLGDAAERLAREVKEIAVDFDFVVIDAGSGLGPGAGFLAAATDEVVVVSTTEPTSLADAHAAIRRFHELRIARVRVLVNQARSHAEGVEVLDEIVNISRQFRGAVVAPLGPGFIRLDSHVPLAVRGRRPFMTAFPSAAASRGMRRIARALCLERYPEDRKKGGGIRAVLEARFLLARGGGRLTTKANDRKADAGEPFSGRSRLEGE